MAGNPRSTFASVNSENLKLVYLRRRLVEKLLMDPDTFESKVVGSYVRIKNDKHDYSQKNSHQLLQVTGVRKAPPCSDGGAEYFLQVPYFLMEKLPISMLDDKFFKQEECEDLHQRILAGSAHRPTVMELQSKAEMLHKDLTEEAIASKLEHLKLMIEHSNLKGWRKEMFECIESKKLLENPAEQERLLLLSPTVIAEPADHAEETTDGAEAVPSAQDDEAAEENKSSEELLADAPESETAPPVQQLSSSRPKRARKAPKWLDDFERPKEDY